MSTAAELLIEQPADGVRLLRLNRPQVRNALNMRLRRQLVQGIAEAQDDPSIRVVIVAGNERAFAAGADITEMAGASTADMMRRGVLELWRATAACSKPMIAAVRGHALGGGCELALLCDLVVAGEAARFGQPEIRIGIIPGGGGTQRLVAALGKHKAMKYLLTGATFSGREAFDMGLASEVVPDHLVEARALELASEIASLSPIAVQQLKEVVLRGMDLPLDAGLSLETKSLHLLFSTEDQKEGMAAFLEKRPARFLGR